jgi:hypothetical protein
MTNHSTTSHVKTWSGLILNQQDERNLGEITPPFSKEGQEGIE